MPKAILLMGKDLQHEPNVTIQVIEFRPQVAPRHAWPHQSWAKQEATREGREATAKNLSRFY